ncbi:amino acid transporter [Patellaria atrata CBS 101060]|uniref:Amino acid transporter n=1 Tax=Patellaria atrata CBS 101060 TaxID=1346257 RepID=A0A9P4SFB6_9PEZI|nr:amino acid transporter [Patellaria atrata CBS 101060]
MAKYELHNVRKTEQHDSDNEEARSLLSEGSEDSDIIVHSGDHAPKPPDQPRRQSSFAQRRPDGIPRTPNRVRFDVEPNGHVEEWIEEEDYIGNGAPHGSGRQQGQHGQRLPLLTGIEAPSVTLASDVDTDDEDPLESARPKSGMWSAFMNMANSIIGAGIIGQPYAFRQAGLITGTILLVALTVTVDWTIRLIVINSKLSGANSFQTTVEYCFGKSGLIAISVAQWAFAFGGMVAFCIIVGDTIPHVFLALFPSIPNMHFLWLLTDRRAVIVIFILGISYPLSLYRDIAKLAKASTLAIISMSIIIFTVVTQGVRIPAELKGPIKGSIIINSGVFQAIGVISFAFVCHHNSLLIYGSLQKPTLDRFARVTHWSTGISMIACLIMAFSGCFGLNMLTTLPLEAFVCREVMTNYYFPDELWNPNRHLIFTTSLVVTAMTLSLMTCDLGAVFELIGATSACALAYILPPLCYIKLSTRSWKTYCAIGCVAFGSAVFVISLLQAIVQIVRSE